MKCPECDGYGKVGKYNYYGTCPQCGGTGEMETEMTNEEWLKSLNTEQLAEFLNAIIRVAPYDELEPKSFWEHLHPYDGGKKGIVEWLKQPHREENEK